MKLKNRQNVEMFLTHSRVGRILLHIAAFARGTFARGQKHFIWHFRLILRNSKTQRPQNPDSKECHGDSDPGRSWGLAGTCKRLAELIY